MVVTTHSVPRVIMRGVEVDNMVFICSFGRRSTGVLVVVDEESCRRNSKKRRPEGIIKRLQILLIFCGQNHCDKCLLKGVGAWALGRRGTSQAATRTY